MRLGLPCPFELAVAPSGLLFGVHRWNESSDIWAICRITLVVGSGWLFRCGGPNIVGDPAHVLVMVGGWGGEKVERKGKEEGVRADRADMDLRK